MPLISDVRILSVTKQPRDTLRVDITIQNTGNHTHAFNVGCSIGRADVEDGFSEGGEWHDVDIYNDGFGEYVQITLNPSESGSVYRTFYLNPSLNPMCWNDVWARALDTNLNELDKAFLYNEFKVGGGTYSWSQWPVSNPYTAGELISYPPPVFGDIKTRFEIGEDIYTVFTFSISGDTPYLFKLYKDNVFTGNISEGVLFGPVTNQTGWYYWSNTVVLGVGKFKLELYLNSIHVTTWSFGVAADPMPLECWTV